MSRKVKSVSFNLDDPWENEMYQHSLRFSNFSSFVKRLIQNSLQSKSVNLQDHLQIEKPPMEQVVISPEHLKQLI